MRLHPAFVLLLALAAAPGLAAGTDQAEAEARLAAVRAEIARLGGEQRRLDEARDAAARELREADGRVQAALAALREGEAALGTQEAELVRLETERGEQEQRLGAQRAELAALLRSSYALGRHEQLKLLLAQDRIESAERALGYARVLQRQRLSRIETLRAELAVLLDLARAVEAQRVEVEAAVALQRVQVEALEGERVERRALLARLERERGRTTRQLDALEQDEKALLALIERLTDVFADIPRELGENRAMADERGRLPWPLQGRVRGAFGGTLPDGRRSSGWMIAAEAGAEVRAVSRGRVAYADWLNGYGLIVILDHGDGYHSLYAHADALLCEVGDWVEAGTPIAHAGSSGGIAEPSLYFELRQRGRPVDPKSWLRRR